MLDKRKPYRAKNKLINILENNKEMGYLAVTIFSDQTKEPISGAEVNIYKFVVKGLYGEAGDEELIVSYITDENGKIRLIGYRSKLKISVTRLIDVIFPELPSLFWSIHQASSYALLLEFPTPNDIKSCHLTKLTNIITKSSNGRYGKEKAITLKELASNSIGSANRSVAFELLQTIRLIQSVQNEIDILNKQIKIVVDEIASAIVKLPSGEKLVSFLPTNNPVSYAFLTS